MVLTRREAEAYEDRLKLFGLLGLQALGRDQRDLRFREGVLLEALWT
jgi:hypothetical protein